MNLKYCKICLPVALFLIPAILSAELVVTVSPPKVTGQKAIVELKMKNSFHENVESARAICFLVDEQGKMIGQATKWVIGGEKNRAALEPSKETSFNFVLTSQQPYQSTNLTANLNFNRIILANGILADPKKDVHILPK